MPRKPVLSQPAADHLFALARGFMGPRVLLTAVELNLFEALEDRPRSAGELADHLGADLRAMEILLDALAALGVLREEGGRFSLVEQFAPILAPGTGGMPLRHAARLWDVWSGLTECVLSGRPASAGHFEGGAEDWIADIQALSRSDVEALCRAFDFSRLERIVDVGGGAGALALPIAERYAGLRVDIIDSNARALARAEDEARRMMLCDRVVCRQGDFFEFAPSEPYDAALLSGVLCLFAPEDNLRLLKRVHEALRGGGHILVRDIMVHGAQEANRHPALFAVHLLLVSPTGRVYSADDEADLLRKSGFTDLRRIPLKGSQLLIARK